VARSSNSFGVTSTGGSSSRRPRCDGRVLLGLEAPAHLPPVELGDHDVEQDQLGADIAGAVDGVGAVAGDDDVVPFLHEVIAEKLRDVLLVFDDEDATGAGGEGGCAPHTRRLARRGYRSVTLR
jgi:hypothetical protein